MAELNVELVAVERMLWEGKATILTAQTTEGEIGVLPGHEPMLGQLVGHGIVTIRPVDGEKLTAAVTGGFLSVSREKVTVLADTAVWANEVDKAQAEANLKSDDPEVVSAARGQLAALARAQEA
ncbi:MAG: F0F1 ATP synthase subunit epsilon [Corynebacterium sp.]|nr:F0F1 ATP synthase subunit epsilon [Corynebacterium sp.]